MYKVKEKKCMAKWFRFYKTVVHVHICLNNFIQAERWGRKREIEEKKKQKIILNIFSWINVIGRKDSNIRSTYPCYVFVFISTIVSVRNFMETVTNLETIESRVISITIEMQNPNTIKPKLPTDIDSRLIPYSKRFCDIFQYSSSKNSNNKYHKKTVVQQTASEQSDRNIETVWELIS